MTVSELYTLFLELMDDAEGVDEEDNLFLFDPFFLREINRAQELAAQAGKLIWDQDTSSACKIELEDGVRSYSLSPKILQLEQVWYGDVALKKTRRQDIDGALPTDEGAPTEFWVRNRTIYFNPIPGSAEDGEEITLGVYRLPLDTLTANDEPEIDAQYHESLLEWVKYRALIRADEDTETKQDALAALANFERIFGKAVPADVMRHQLEEPRMLRMGPGAIYN